MMETVNATERNYKGALPYGKKKIDGKLGGSDEKMERIVRNRPYVVRDGIKIIIDETARVAYEDGRRSSTAIFVSGLAEILKLIVTKIFSTFAQIAAECGRHIMDTEVRRTFKKSEYVMGNIIRQYRMLI